MSFSSIPQALNMSDMTRHKQEKSRVRSLTLLSFATAVDSGQASGLGRPQGQVFTLACLSMLITYTVSGLTDGKDSFSGIEGGEIYRHVYQMCCA